MPVIQQLLAGLTARIMPGWHSLPGLPPWRFGMTPQQVAAFSQHAPYFRFANGDLETFSGIFDGRQQNIQFFFDDARLEKIGINLYEGSDAESGRLAWLDAYHAMRRLYGGLDLTLDDATDQHEPELLSQAAKQDVLSGGMQQMAPVRRQPGMSVYATYAAAQIKEHRYFYVIILFESD